MVKVDNLKEEKEWDSIVIGSGMGGLTVASLLAQCEPNHRVLVLEQNKYNIGGCCQSFERKGYPFGVGIHYVTDLDETKKGSLKKFVDALTPEGDSIEWTRMPDHFETLMIGKDELRQYDIIAKRTEESLAEQFPDEKEGIEKFFEMARKANKAFEQGNLFKALPRPLTSFLVKTGLHRWFDGGFSKYSRLTVEEVVESLTDNADLRAVLEYMGGDYGVPANKAPFSLHAMIYLAYCGGAFYPTGGPGQIPTKITRAIAACGGEVRHNCKVKRILTEDGRAVGVELDDGKAFKAKRVISDAGFINTFNHMLPPKYRPLFLQTIDAQPSSRNTLDTGQATGMMLYIGLKGDYDADFQLPDHHLVVAAEDATRKMYYLPETLTALKCLDPKDLSMMITCPAAKDDSWKTSNPGETTLEIILFAPWKAFEDMIDSQGDLKETKRNEYDEFKRTFGELVWTRARQALVAAGASSTRLPVRLADADVFDLATPLTFARFLGSDRGSWYGLVHDTNRYSPSHSYLDLRPDCPQLSGLYMTGQDVAGDGMVGAMFGGYFCAAKVLNENNPLDLEKKVGQNRAKMDNE